MKQRMFKTLVMTFCALFCILTSVNSTLGASLPKISFRLDKPRAAHFGTTKEANANVTAFKQLGCTAKQHGHNGHVDVTYECPEWRTITLKDSQEVTQWQEWLRAKGFAIVHNTPSTSHEETVKYRLAEWRVFHFHKPDQATAHVAMMRMLGCEVKRSQHAGHEDVAVRCPGWQTIGLADHDEAHQWEAALKKFGFMTLHEH